MTIKIGNQTFEMGDEIANEEDTISGILVEVEGDVMLLIDEYHTSYRFVMSGYFRKVNYISPEEKADILSYYEWLKGGKKGLRKHEVD